MSCLGYVHMVPVLRKQHTVKLRWFYFAEVNQHVMAAPNCSQVLTKIVCALCHHGLY
jgi:hypothetical protein